MSSHSQDNCHLFAFPEHLFSRTTISVGNLLAGFLCTPPGWAVCTLSKDFGLFGAAVNVAGTEQERTGLRLSLKGRRKDVPLVLRKDNSSLRGGILSILDLPAPPRSVFRRSR